MTTPNYSNETLDRIKKLEKIKDFGVNPFATKFDANHQIAQILEKFKSSLDEGETSPLRDVTDVVASPKSEFSVAGRVMLHRSFGKICFATINDGTGKIQILFSRENCKIRVGGQSLEILKNSENEEMSAYKFAEKLVDMGDFIGVRGELFYTHKGELTIFAEEFSFLTKAIRPLPEKFHGIESDEERYRKRYLDMATDDELRAMFVRKSKFWDATREYLKQHGFLEVETPTLEHTTGGAEARPFATHHNDYDVDVFLRISIGELWQKRLMAGGFPKTFEIGRAYRNEGSSPDHLQEFTNLEFYWAYADYEDGMRFVQGLYQHIAKSVYGTTKFSHKGLEFDLAGEWPRIDYLTAVEERTGINLLTATDDEMRQKLEELGVKYEGTNRERLTDTLWKYVRKQIAGPAFLVNHPELISPLAKVSEKFPGKVERFQPIIAGSEVGNGYSELNDPIDQRERFEKQQEMLEGGDDEAMMPDWEFIEMLEHGMPPTCGFGFGERLFAFLEGKPIREVQYFPFMKQTQSEKKSDEK